MRLSDAVQAAEPYAEKLRAGELQPRPMPAPSVPPIDFPGPGLGMFVKCPLPGISVAPDSLRQFYRSGIPQHRTIAPSPLTT